MNRLKLLAKGATRIQPAQITQNPPKWPHQWRNSPAALKAWALRNGYTLAGTRQK